MQTSRVAFYSLPLVVDVKGFVGSDDGNACALNVATGQLLWRTDLMESADVLHSPPRAWSSVAPAAAASMPCSRWMAALAGKFLWLIARGLNLPVVLYGVVHVGAYDGNMYALFGL